MSSKPAGEATGRLRFRELHVSTSARTPWQCPACETWMAWWVREHHCAYPRTHPELPPGVEKR